MKRNILTHLLRDLWRLSANIKLKREGTSEDGRGMDGVKAELAQHIKPQSKREARFAVPEPLSENRERWRGLCREHGDWKRENKDRTSETEKDIWENRKAEDGERTRNPHQVETRSRANRSDLQLFFCKRGAGGLPFPTSVNEKFFYPPKRKG